MTRKEIIKHYKSHFGLEDLPRLGRGDKLSIEWAESLLESTPKQIEAKEMPTDAIFSLFDACNTVVNGYEGDGMECMQERDDVFYRECKNAVRKYLDACQSEQSLPKERKKDLITSYVNKSSELGDELCQYCNLDKKGVYGVDGGYVAGCEGSKCNEAYDNYLEQINSIEKKSLPKEPTPELRDEDIYKWAKLESELNYPSEQAKRIIFQAGLVYGAKSGRDDKINSREKINKP